MKTISKNLIVVSGPTASGKTETAIALAKYLNTEIISADSRQFYREIPIGTAAPDAHQLAEVKHHLVGHLSVRDDYNVSYFEHEVLQLLHKLFRTTDAVIMVGGSGLYIDAVCKGIDELPDPDKKIRNILNELFQEKGIEVLRSQLERLDPEYYAQVDLNNPKRLMRAIEVCLQTGKPYSEQRLNRPKKRDFNIIKTGIDVPREILNERIGRRAQKMLDKGWIEEARSVYPLKSYNALNTVGYKELFKYLDGEWDLETATQKIITNTRRYARRQMTWFRKDEDITWVPPSPEKEIFSFVETKLTGSTQNI